MINWIVSLLIVGTFQIATSKDGVVWSEWKTVVSSESIELNNDTWFQLKADSPHFFPKTIYWNEKK